MKTIILGERDYLRCDCGLPWFRSDNVAIGGPIKLRPDEDGWFLCSGCGQTRFTWTDLVQEKRAP